MYCLFLNVLLWLICLNRREYNIKIAKGEIEYSCKGYYSGLILIMRLYCLVLLGLFVIGLFIVVYSLFVYSLWSASVSYWFSVYCLLDIVCSVLLVSNGLIFLGFIFYSVVLVYLLWLLLLKKNKGKCEVSVRNIVKYRCKVHYSRLVVIMSLYCLFLVALFCCGLYYVVYDISV